MEGGILGALKGFRVGLFYGRATCGVYGFISILVFVTRVYGPFSFFGDIIVVLKGSISTLGFFSRVLGFLLSFGEGLYGGVSYHVKIRGSFVVGTRVFFRGERVVVLIFVKIYYSGTIQGCVGGYFYVWGY